jgi:hypothetical protein
MTKLFIKDVSALMSAYGNELKGYTPGEEIDVNTWKFPVFLKLDTKKKLIYLEQEEAVDPEAPAETVKVGSTVATKGEKYAKIVVISIAVIILVAIVTAIIHNAVK